MKLTIWNKTVQNLLMSKQEDAILLGLMLVNRVEEVCGWRYMELRHCQQLNLPHIYYEDDEIFDVLCIHYPGKYRQSSNTTTGEHFSYLKNAYANYLG